MMRVTLFLIFTLSLLIASCAPASTPVPETQVLSVYVTPATQPWLADVYACTPTGAGIRLVNDPISADISLGLGEPDFAPASTYQIDTEEILVVTHRQSPVQNLTLEEARELFAGQGELAVDVWVYASGEDMQQVFEQAVMQGRSVTTYASIATNPQHMSDTLNNQPNTIGLLPRRWKMGDSRVVYTIPDVPVLAVVSERPQGAIQTIIACLQK